MAQPNEDYGGVPFPKLPPDEGGYGEPPGAWEEVHPSPQPPPPQFDPEMWLRYGPPQPPQSQWGGGGYGEPPGAWQETRPQPQPQYLPVFYQEGGGGGGGPSSSSRVQPPLPSFLTGGIPLLPLMASNVGGTQTVSAPRPPVVPQIQRDVLRPAQQSIADWYGRTATTVARNLLPAIPEEARTPLDVATWALGAPASGLGKLMELAQRPYNELVLPQIARSWTQQYSPELVQQAGDIRAQREALDKRLAIGAYPPLTDAERQRLRAQRAALDEQLLQMGNRERQVNPGLGYVIPPGERGTAADVQRYQQEAPGAVQLVHAAVFDPLNFVASATGPAWDALKQFRASRYVAPTTKTVEQVTQDLAREGQVTNSLLGRVSPFRLTPSAQSASLVNQAIDTVNVVTQNTPNPLAALDAFIRNPDSLATATGGFSSSPVAKRTAALMRRALTDASGQVDYGRLAKIVHDAKGDSLQAVADLARTYQDAAESFFPPR